MSLRSRCLIFVLLGIGACSRESAPGAGSQETGPTQARSAGAQAQAQTAPTQAREPADAPEPAELGRLLDTGVIELAQIAGKTPAQVDAVLGEPRERGSERISCVRFLPERVFFACEEEVRLYDHAQLSEVRVEFEDGRAAVVSLIGLPGEGPFELAQALRLAGLSLPSEPPPRELQARSGDQGRVELYRWGNARARLRIGGLEHRVRLTVIDGEWRRSKLELILNHPLNEDQRRRIKAPSPPSGAG